MITWDEFKAGPHELPASKYKETNIECPQCKKPLYKRMDIVLTSYPAKYRYECLNCDWVGVN